MRTNKYDHSTDKTNKSNISLGEMTSIFRKLSNKLDKERKLSKFENEEKNK